MCLQTVQRDQVAKRDEEMNSVDGRPVKRGSPPAPIKSLTPRLTHGSADPSASPIVISTDATLEDGDSSVFEKSGQNAPPAFPFQSSHLLTSSKNSRYDEAMSISRPMLSTISSETSSAGMQSVPLDRSRGGKADERDDTPALYRSKEMLKKSYAAQSLAKLREGSFDSEEGVEAEVMEEADVVLDAHHTSFEAVAVTSTAKGDHMHSPEFELPKMCLSMEVLNSPPPAQEDQQRHQKKRPFGCLEQSPLPATAGQGHSGLTAEIHSIHLEPSPKRLHPSSPDSRSPDTEPQLLSSNNLHDQSLATNVSMDVPLASVQTSSPARPSLDLSLPAEGASPEAVAEQQVCESCSGEGRATCQEGKRPVLHLAKRITHFMTMPSSQGSGSCSASEFSRHSPSRHGKNDVGFMVSPLLVCLLVCKLLQSTIILFFIILSQNLRAKFTCRGIEAPFRIIGFV